MRHKSFNPDKIKSRKGVAVFVVSYILYGIIKSGRQMYRLQNLAEQFNDDFKRYIYRSEGWKVSDVPRKDWYKLIDGNGNPYYIHFEGRISFQTAVKFLINGFKRSINVTQ